MITQWTDALRNSPIFPYDVREYNNWRTNRPLGSLASLDGVFWHHDASGKGPSPGNVQWLITAYNAKKPSAQIIVSYDGTWNFVGSGRAYHAGTVRGSLGFANSVGVESDQTVGETMSPRMKDSLERGFAVICHLEGRNADFVTFHKIEAFPRGRKPDPYFSGNNDPSQWNGELAQERNVIQGWIDRLRNGKDELDMATKDEVKQWVREVLDERGWQPNSPEQFVAHVSYGALRALESRPADLDAVRILDAGADEPTE